MNSISFFLEKSTIFYLDCIDIFAENKKGGGMC